MDKHLSSTRNHLVQHLKNVHKSRQYRLAHNSAIIQGKKLFFEQFQTLEIKHLFLLPSYTPPPEIDPNKIYYVTESILKYITSLPSPEGILAEVTKPKIQSLDFTGKTLLLDGLQDPGNLGTLIRTALAFSWQRVLALSPSVDFFNDKVIRSSKGAVFKLPCYELELQSFLDREDLPSIYVGHIEGEPLNLLNDMPNNFIMALGNEAFGPREALLKQANKVTIPISNEMESLNVAIAGGIIMHHFNSYEGSL